MNWHRVFGLILTDFFAGTPFIVELEKDLSAKKQLLDVQDLFAAYQQEGISVAYTIQDYVREHLQEKLLQLPPEEQKAVLEKLPAEQRLEGLSTQEIENYLKRRRQAAPTRKRKKPG